MCAVSQRGLVYGLSLGFSLWFQGVHSYVAYRGCFIDQWQPRAMDAATYYKDEQNMTLVVCEQHCRDTTNYTFMGLQFAYDCFCGDTYAQYGRAPETECNMPCTGDVTQTCGASVRNSVYAVCPTRRWGERCEKQCHCDGQEVCNRLNGTCSSTCRPGWAGTSCSRPDCSNMNGNCSHACETNEDSFWCTCNSGYELDSDGKECNDVDECKTEQHLCWSEGGYCQNTIGSYNCSCPVGYELADGDVHNCTDVDECLSDNGGCDHICTNTAGSFNCSCRHPDVLKNKKQCEGICESTFRLRIPRAGNIASGCYTLKTLTNATLAQAKSSACGVAANVIATVSDIYLIKKCFTDDLQLRVTSEGRGWNIYQRSLAVADPTQTALTKRAEHVAAWVIITAVVAPVAFIVVIIVVAVLLVRRRRQRKAASICEEGPSAQVYYKHMVDE